MKVTETHDEIRLDAALRGMARAEAEALDTSAFLNRMRRTLLDEAPDRREGRGGRPALGASNACAAWLALPMGLALAGTAWLAAGLLEQGAIQWSAVMTPASGALNPVPSGVLQWAEAAVTQAVGLVLSAWCAWATWQLRR